MIETEIIIDAPIDKIWSILIDFPSYPNWNPFIRAIDGKLQMNEQLTVTIQSSNTKTMRFYPRIITLSEYELIWRGKLGVQGIFDGAHRFKLLPLDKKVKFIHSEVFTGLLHVPIFNLIGESTKNGFDNMNKVLKNRCES
jgi:hypothetical protein